MVVKDFQATSGAGCVRFGEGPEVTPHVHSNLSRFQRWAKRLMGAETIQKKTEITVETDRLLVIRRRQLVRAWCEECGSEVDTLSLDEAASMTGTSSALSRKTWMAAWHLCEGADGAPRICLESLLKSM
jgi:hypothetical protein